MNNEQKNKLTEMAREYYAEYSPFADVRCPKLMADFAQHVLDKQWTRIEDGLPKEDGDYLITFRWSDENIWSVAEEYFDGDRWDEDYSSISNRIIIAWCKLPQPYVQPEKQEEYDI